MANSGQRNRRPAWDDRFRRPTDEDLAAALSPAARAPFAYARECFTDRFGAVETLGWMGVPWQWCYRYDRGGGKPLAYLVPSPARPLLALPLEAQVLAERPAASLSRRQQEAIAAGTRVGDVLWLNWEISSRALLDEALALVPIEAAGSPAARRGPTSASSRAPVGATGRSGR